MNLSRKLKRKHHKKRMKQIKTVTKNLSRRMDSLGGSCRNCAAEFNRLDPGDLSSWTVYVIEEKPNLICPSCQELIQRAKNEMSLKEEIDA